MEVINIRKIKTSEMHKNSGSHTGGKVTTRDHHDFLMEYLADKKKATAYLNAEVEEGE